MNKKSALGRSWDELEQELFTPEEIAAGKARVAPLIAAIDARQAAERLERQANASVRIGAAAG